MNRIFRRLLPLLHCLALTASVGATDAPSAVGQSAPESARDLRAYVAAELAHGNQRIVIPPGRYRVKPDGGTHLLFRDLRDLEIVAEGVELVCTATVQALGFERCTNVTLRGLTIDYDPLPFTQGKIVALGPEKSWVEFELFDGYPDGRLVERIEIFDPATRELRRASHYGWGAFARTGPRRYRISKGSNYRHRAAVDTEEVGDLLVTNHRPPAPGENHAVRVRRVVPASRCRT
jgi:hypothetical protein